MHLKLFQGSYSKTAKAACDWTGNKTADVAPKSYKDINITGNTTSTRIQTENTSKYKDRDAYYLKKHKKNIDELRSI